MASASAEEASIVALLLPLSVHLPFRVYLYTFSLFLFLSLSVFFSHPSGVPTLPPPCCPSGGPQKAAPASHKNIKARPELTKLYHSGLDTEWKCTASLVRFNGYNLMVPANGVPPKKLIRVPYERHDSGRG